jgi:hypothetical protein
MSKDDPRAPGAGRVEGTNELQCREDEASSVTTTRVILRRTTPTPALPGSLRVHTDSVTGHVPSV